MEHDLNLKYRGWSEDDASPPQRDRAWFAGDIAQSSPGHCSGQRGRTDDAVSWGPAYCITLVTTLSYWKPLGAPRLLYPSDKPSTCPSTLRWRAMILLLCALLERGKLKGDSCKKDHSEGEHESEGWQRQGEWREAAHHLCTLSLHAGEHPLNPRFCSHETNWPNLMPLGGPPNSLLTINRLERSTSSPLPSLLIPSSAPALHCESESPLIHCVTMPRDPHF